MRRIFYKAICCILLFAILLTSGFTTPSVQAEGGGGQSSTFTLLSVPTMAADAAPVIDGDIGDEVWSRAAETTGFVTFTQSEAIPEPTSFKAFFTEDKLYIAVRAVQAQRPDGRVTEHDGPVYTEDSIEIFFQPDLSDATTYYQFIVNAIGTKYEGKGRNASWNGEWKAAPRMSDGYWDVEIEIPAASLGLTSFSAQEYGINVCRSQSVGAQGGTGPWSIPAMIQSSWAPYPGGSFHDPNGFGRLSRNDGDAFVVRHTGNANDLKSGFYTLSNVMTTTDSAITVKAVQTVKTKGSDSVLGEPMELTQTADGASSMAFALQRPLQPGEWDCLLSLTDADTGKVYYSRKIPVNIPSSMKVRKYWSEQMVAVSLDKNEVMTAFTAQSCLFELKNSAGAVTLEGEVAADSNGIFTYEFPMEGQPAGNYEIVATLKGDGETHALPAVALEKPEIPEWWDSQLGKDNVVLAPWTGLKISGNTVSSWGRDYTFGDSPFVSQITSLGQDLLAAPIKIEGTADAQVLSFFETNDESVDKTETKYQYLNESVSGDLKLDVVSTVEYDGFVRFDVTLSSDSGEPVQLQDLKVKIPMKPETATLFDADTTDSPLRGTYPYWSGAQSGKFPVAAAGSFTPHIFIGNDKVGLTWVAESTQNWSFHNPENVLVLKKQGDAHVLEMNVVDKAIEVRENEPLTFTFAIQASPIRPQAENKQLFIYGSSAYGAEGWGMNIASENNGQLTYPAKDYVTAEYGDLTVEIIPKDWTNYSWLGAYPDDPQNEMSTPVIAVQFPNGNSFGLYYGLGRNHNLFLVTQTGFNQNRVRHEIQEFAYPNGWHRWWERQVRLTWDGDSMKVAFGNWTTVFEFETMAEIPFDFGLMNASMQEAKIVFGTGFIYNWFTARNENGNPIAEFVSALDTTVSGRELTGNYEITANGLFVGGPDPSLGPNRSWPNFLERLKMDNYQLLKIHEDWTESQGYPMTREQGRKDAFHTLAAACNEKGIPLLPYIGFQLGDNTPEFKHYKDEIVTEPFFLPNGWVRSDTNHIGANVSYAGRFQNFMLWSIEKLIREEGIGGLYMDSTALPPKDQNVHNGAGYYDRDGVLQSSYPIFAYRDFMKRLRTMATAIRPDFYMDLHTPIGTWTPTAGFCDSIWKGEQFLNAEANPSEETFRREVTPELLRATMGTQTGLAVNFLNYAQVDTASAAAAVLDIPVRGDGLLRSKVMEYYDLNNADFVLYSDSNIAGSTETTPMSYYRRTDGTVVAVTANLSAEDQPADVTFTLPEGLIMAGSIATDAINGDDMVLNGNMLTVHFEKSWRYKYILLASESVETPVRYPFEWPSIGFVED